jgi:hypothetical protein
MRRKVRGDSEMKRKRGVVAAAVLIAALAVTLNVTPSAAQEPPPPISLLVLVGGGVVVGLAFSWWGLLASVGFACFLAYGWEFGSEGVAYATIAGLVASGRSSSGACCVEGFDSRRKLSACE